MKDIIPLFQNKDHTVGIIKIEGDKTELKRIPGWFNKELFIEMADLFDLFQRRDMALYFRDGVGTNSEGASLLLICPDEMKDMYIAVAGRTEMTE